MWNWLRNRRIRTQVTLLAAVGILSLVVVAAVFQTSDARNSALRAQRDDVMLALNRATDIERYLGAARVEELEFAIVHDMHLAELFDGHLAESRTALEALRSGGADGERLAALGEGADRYASLFADYVRVSVDVGLDEKPGLLGNLRTAVHSIEGELETTDAPELQVLMLMMRRHEKDFLARLDSKYIGRLDDRVAEFEAALPVSSVPRARHDAILTKLETYRSDFHAMAEGILERERLRAEMSDAFAAIQPVIAEMRDVYVARYDEVEGAVQRNTSLATQIIWGAFAVALIVLLVAAWRIGRGISTPVEVLTDRMSALARNELDTDVPYGERANEIGAMAQALAVFRDNMREAERLAEAQLLAERQKAERAVLIENLTARFDTAVGGLLENFGSASSQLETTAHVMSAAADRTTSRATTVAGAAEETSANVDTVATASEELNASINEISRQVTEAAETALRAVREADQTNETVESLTETSRKIVEVTSLINDISEQTNLLALNATIEAARAGEAGKGFAVVASEVKSLANQTSQATEEIGAQIAAIQASSENAVLAIRNIGRTIREVSDIAAAIAAAVEEQGAATGEISRSVLQAANGTREVSRHIGEVNATAGESGNAAGEVLVAARALSEHSHSLRGEVQTFLSGIKAA